MFFLALQQVLVEVHVEVAAAVALVLILGKDVEGDVDLREVLRVDLACQRQEKLSEDLLPHGCAGALQLCEDDTDAQALAVPAPHVGLPDARIEDPADAVDDDQVRVWIHELRDVDDHEHEGLLRALGSLALEGEHAVEIVLVVKALYPVEHIGFSGMRFYQLEFSGPNVFQCNLPCPNLAESLATNVPTYCVPDLIFRSRHTSC